MEKKNLKIKDLIVLSNEINMLLPTKLNHMFKLQLMELFERVQKVLEPVEKVKQEIIKTNLGVVKETMPEHEIAKKKGYTEFQKQFNEVLEDRREIKYIPINQKFFDFESEFVFVQLYKLVDKTGNEDAGEEREEPANAEAKMKKVV